MTTTSSPPGTVADKIAACRSEVDAVTVDAAADPSALAADLRAWRHRESVRQDKILDLEERVRALGQYGELVDTPHLDTIRSYTARVAEARQLLTYPAEHRRYRDAGGVHGANALARALAGWWDALMDTARDLPGIPDATRWVDAELTEWFTARDATIDAHIDFHADGHEFPRPELANGGLLPTGSRYGIHRTETTQ